MKVFQGSQELPGLTVGKTKMEGDKSIIMSGQSKGWNHVFVVVNISSFIHIAEYSRTVSINPFLRNFIWGWEIDWGGGKASKLSNCSWSSTILNYSAWFCMTLFNSFMILHYMPDPTKGKLHNVKLLPSLQIFIILLSESPLDFIKSRAIQ